VPEEPPQPMAAAIVNTVKTKAGRRNTYGFVRISGSRKQENITTSQIGELAEHFRGGEIFWSYRF
jgi:hypothetical protein